MWRADRLAEVSALVKAVERAAVDARDDLDLTLEQEVQVVRDVAAMEQHLRGPAREGGRAGERGESEGEGCAPIRSRLQVEATWRGE